MKNCSEGQPRRTLRSQGPTTGELSGDVGKTPTNIMTPELIVLGPVEGEMHRHKLQDHLCL